MVMHPTLMHHLFDVATRTFAVPALFAHEYPVALASFDRRVQDAIDLLLAHAVIERGVLLASDILEQIGLQFRSQMLLQAPFRVALHLRIQGGIHFQTIGIDIVRTTVGFGEPQFVVLVLLGQHAFEPGEGFRRETEQVGGLAYQIGIDELLDELVAEAFEEGNVVGPVGLAHGERIRLVGADDGVEHETLLSRFRV